MAVPLHSLPLLLLTLCHARVHLAVDFRQTAANKAFIDSLSDGEYEIVHPFQIREKNDRIGIDTRNYFLRGAEHFEQVTIVIRSTTLGRLKVVAARNDHLILNQTAFRKLDISGEHAISNRIENCFYQGSIAGDPDSFAAFSSCNGLRGILAYSNGSVYGLHPLDGGDQSKRHPHVLYRARWPSQAKCGAASSLPALAAQALHSAESRHKHRRDMSKQTKHVEVALIGDYEFMRERVSDEYAAISYMLDAVNIADLMLARDLNVRLCVVYAEMWTDVQRVDLFADSAATLAGLVDYATGHIYNIGKDATVLFTGGKFANDEATTSSFRSVCTARAAAIVKAVDAFSSSWSAQLLAQATGHILGLEHDSVSCTCPHCVMSARPGSVGGPFAWQFSKCSVARMHGVWQSGHVHCLLNRPFQESSLRTCGNGVVEGAEECDCGGRESCSDPCCDPLTCTLQAHAQCAAHHACCNRCQLQPPSHVCRPSAGSCDVAETCSGRHGDCPSDGHLVDGSACGSTGHCWRGNCSDPSAQCNALWGSTASLADPACFDQNTVGHLYANCGEGGACAPADAQCGTLHCQGGDIHPTVGSKSFAFQFVHEGRNVQCKVVADPAGMVRDGSACGPGRVCVSSSCVEMVQVSAPVSCPTNNVALGCSGHGDCTTSGSCVCSLGWSGEACDRRVTSPRPPQPPLISVPSLAVGKALDTATLLIILLAVGVFLLLLLVCLLFCYRRRSHLDIPLPSDEKSIEAVPESQRAIKFGNMPSYREEKLKKRNNKRIYGALNRITEADEKDSASLRSRESALMAEKTIPSSRSDVGVSHGDLHEHAYAASVIGIGREEREDYPIDYPFPGPAHWRDHSPSFPHPRYSAPCRPPLQLNNISQMMKRLQYSSDEEGRGGGRYEEEEEMEAVEAELEAVASNTESSRACEDSPQFLPGEEGETHPLAPPSHLPFRNSPSLFSDPFKLEMSSSIHT